MEEQINNLPPAEEIKAPVTEVAPVEETRVVDEAPDPSKLRAEVEELESKRRKAEEDTYIGANKKQRREPIILREKRNLL